ncbi:hypothetical protein HAX54_039704 [Datura stramonium]|uniref:Uncharacterized protein n=1 Tax=Datura stramonium TaxID=4076 RepID=A0ABS8VPL7_DATST|nr:hypothetical protein [Datura stramonium]
MWCSLSVIKNGAIAGVKVENCHSSSVTAGEAPRQYLSLRRSLSNPKGCKGPNLPTDRSCDIILKRCTNRDRRHTDESPITIEVYLCFFKSRHFMDPLLCFIRVSPVLPVLHISKISIVCHPMVTIPCFSLE